jgi:dolichol-phosphate mannosyltransferase
LNNGLPLDPDFVPTLSVVLSFRDEEENIPELVRRLRQVLGTEIFQGLLARYELVFVNDDSRDRSLQLLLEAAQGHNDIRIINMARNFGVTPCVLAGLDYSSGDLVVYMDADLQDPPEVIADMLAAWWGQGRPDVIHTVRRSRAGESFLKLKLTRLGYWILRRISAVPIRMEAGDFKMLSRRAVDELRKLREKKPFMRGMVAWVGFRQIEILYDRQPRFGGKTKFRAGGIKVIRNFLESALISFSDAPLHLATGVGVFISAASFLGLIYVAAGKFLDLNVPGWTGIMMAVLFLGGVQLLFMGLMGLYIHAIFLEVKGRPNYIVESAFGFPEKTAASVMGIRSQLAESSVPANASQHLKREHP